MTRRIPLLAVLLGILGVLPFIGCGLVALSPDQAQALRMNTALLAYGAVVLAFLGAVHWGFALMAPEPVSARVERLRLMLGVVPALIGWVAVLLQFVLASWAALLLLIVGFVGTALVEHQASRRGLMPRGYMTLRWGLTVVVVAMLTTVLTLRILGQSLLY